MEFKPQSHNLDLAIEVSSRKTFGPDGNYLFKAQSLPLEFLEIQIEMEHLNDYCYACLEESLRRLQSSKDAFKDFESGPPPAPDPKLMGWDDLVTIAPFVNEINKWEDNFLFVSKAMCLILLSFLLEKSLKSLCVAFSPTGNLPKARKNEAKIITYIEFLKQVRNFDFVEPEDFIKTREQCRLLRNSFAHGDWEEVRNEIKAVSLPSAFYATSHLFQILEGNLYPDGGKIPF